LPIAPPCGRYGDTNQCCSRSEVLSEGLCPETRDLLHNRERGRDRPSPQYGQRALRRLSHTRETRAAPIVPTSYAQPRKSRVPGSNLSERQSRNAVLREVLLQLAYQLRLPR